MKGTEQEGLSARQRLAALLADGGQPDAVEAALCIAAEHCPALDIDEERRRVLQIAAEGGRRAAGLANPFARLDAVNTLLFEDFGFRGDSGNYEDPRNSYLNEVLDRRRGIPLTMALLFVEVATAAGFDARGVALPGHFIARIHDGERRILVDPYHRGRVLAEEDCRELVRRTTGKPTLFKKSLLDGASARAMVGRLLLNLKHVFVGRRDWRSALSVVERLLLLRPGNGKEIRDRGLLMAHLGRPVAAIADLERYLTLVPGAPDAESVSGRLRRLRQFREPEA